MSNSILKNAEVILFFDNKPKVFKMESGGSLCKAICSSAKYQGFYSDKISDLSKLWEKIKMPVSKDMEQKFIGLAKKNLQIPISVISQTNMKKYDTNGIIIFSGEDKFYSLSPMDENNIIYGDFLKLLVGDSCKNIPQKSPEKMNREKQLMMDKLMQEKMSISKAIDRKKNKAEKLNKKIVVLSERRDALEIRYNSVKTRYNNIYKIHKTIIDSLITLRKDYTDNITNKDDDYLASVAVAIDQIDNNIERCKSIIIKHMEKKQNLRKMIDTVAHKIQHNEILLSWLS